MCEQFNPYSPREPVQTAAMFFGRSRELQEIAQYLRGNQSVALIGPQGIGKTSLLLHLMRPPAAAEPGLGKECLPGFVDCAALETESSPGVLRHVALVFAAEMESRKLPEEPELRKAHASPSRLSFESSLRALNRRGLQLILILDNFDWLCANSRLGLPFYNALRSMAGRFKLAFLTASANPLFDLTFTGRPEEILTSPFFNIFAPLYLGLLTEAEARDFIQTSAYEFHRPFSNAVCDYLYRLAGGHPFFLQTACSHAWDCPDGPSAIETRTSGDVRPYLETIWQGLTANEQHVAVEISDQAIPTSAVRPDATVLRRLQRQSLLVEKAGSYSSSCKLWKDFLARQSPHRRNGIPAVYPPV